MYMKAVVCIYLLVFILLLSIYTNVDYFSNTTFKTEILRNTTLPHLSDHLD